MRTAFVGASPPGRMASSTSAVGASRTSAQLAGERPARARGAGGGGGAGGVGAVAGGGGGGGRGSAGGGGGGGGGGGCAEVVRGGMGRLVWLGALPFRPIGRAKVWPGIFL